MIHARPLVFLPALLAMHLVACGGDEPAKAPENPAPVDSSQATTTGPTVPSDVGSIVPTPATTSASLPTAAPATPPAPTGASPSTAEAAQAPTALTDEQVLEVTHTANRGELEQAKLAQSKAKDGRVKKLAAMMLKDHGAADAKALAVGRKNNLTLAPSATSTTLEADAQVTTSSLGSQTGMDFDKGYVDAQVKEHQAVLDIIDHKLMPSAKNADVKAFLEEVRPTVAMHLQHAQDLQVAMQK
jgi:putative membrane protein